MVSPLAEDFRDSDNSRQRFSHFDLHLDNDSAAHHSSMDNLCLHWLSQGVRLGRQLQRDDDDERLSRYKTRMRAQAVKYEEEVLLREGYREEMEFLQSELFVLKDALLAAQTAYEELSLSVTTSSSSSHSVQLGSRPHLNVSSPTLLECHDFVNGALFGSGTPQMPCMDHEIDCDQLVDDADQRFPDEFDDFGFSASLSNTESPPSDLSDLSEPDAHSSRTMCKPDDEGQDISEIELLMSAAHEGASIALQRVRTLIQVAERTPKRQRNAAQTHLLLYWRTPKSPRIAALPSPEAPKIFVDASAYGIGFIFNDRWLAWKFITAHPLLPLGPDGKLIISWAELVAVEMGIRTLIAAGFESVTVTIHSDNTGVVTALESGKWTQKYGLNEIVKRILHLSREAGLSLKMKWIRTKENPADNPSRGVYPPAELAFYCRPSIPCYLSDLIQDVE